MTEQREKVARHESRHAVMANHLLGDALQSVELMSDKGRCRLKPLRRLRASNAALVGFIERDYLEKLVMVFLGDGPSNGVDDYDRALEIALELNEGDAEAAELQLKHLARRAALVVQKLGPQITRLSEALVRHGKLSGGEVEAILSK